MILPLAIILPGAWLAARGEILNWAVFAALVVGSLLLAGFLQLERRTLSVREMALIATLAAVAAIGRIPFTALPGFQPTTFLCAVSGMVFGAPAGFAVGAIAAAVSNFFLGQGPWTPWQMLAWGLVGTTAGLLAGPLKRCGRAGLAVFGLVWGYLFGWMVNLWVWTTAFYPLTLQSFLTVQAAGFLFDTLHAAGNVIFAVLIGPDVVRILERFRAKLVARREQSGINCRQNRSRCN